MEILYKDARILVCLKPCGVESTDVPGGVPELLRQTLGEPQGCVRTVHRLDRVVGGVMVLARSRMAAQILSAQIRAHTFQKEYLAVVHGEPGNGTFCDLLFRNKQERKTYVAAEPGKDVQKAVLHYRTLDTANGLSLVHITLETGRTHQIRAQFSAHGFPLVGDRKYGAEALQAHEIALWSYALEFLHPQSGERVRFAALPPQTPPWNSFQKTLDKLQSEAYNEDKSKSSNL
ncbi:MAG: RluA family pseudouridine synthase [Acutalibacteraceae bacterium]